MTPPKFLFIIFIVFTAQMVKANMWKVNGLKLSSVNQQMQISIDEIYSTQIEEKIQTIKYQCQSSFKLYPIHQCDYGKIQFSYLNEAYHFNLKGWFDVKNNNWDIKLTNNERNISLSHSSKNQEKLFINLENMPISDLFLMLKNQFDISQESVLGTISADIEIDFKDLISINGKYQLDEFSWESESGEYVLAETTVVGEWVMNSIDGGFDLQNKTSIESGEGLFKDIYLEFAKEMFVANSFVSIGVDNELNKLQFDFQLTQENTISLDVLDFESLDFEIKYKISNISVLYKKYLKSYLSIMGISKAEFDGESTGNITFKNGEVESINSEITELYMEIESKKIEVNNLNALINWHKNGELLPSTFKWDALLLAGMPINQSELYIKSAGQELKFQEDTEIPIFDGSLDIHKMTLKDIFEPEISIQFDGEVQPISLGLITEKMGWPVMNGYISGKIPGMNKTGNIITFDGLLELSVFEGNMQIQDLSIERLFGIAPVIAADIKFQNLSLLQITSTYDFGDITGNINGFVNGMRITNWKADRLDAYIESVKVKGVKQLISQRAIDNISSIGGVQGAISRSFLKIFDAFRYKKIGIGCKLRNSICEMSGLKTTKNNYQIVEGKGLPSINIFGYRNYIDWQIFLDRLLNASY